MSQPLDGNRLEAGIAEDDLVEISCSGIAVVGRLNIGGQQMPHVWKTLQKANRLFLADGFKVWLNFTTGQLVLAAEVVAQRASNLLSQPIVQSVDC